MKNHYFFAIGQIDFTRRLWGNVLTFWRVLVKNWPTDIITLLKMCSTILSEWLRMECFCICCHIHWCLFFNHLVQSKYGRKSGILQISKTLAFFPCFQKWVYFSCYTPKCTRPVFKNAPTNFPKNRGKTDEGA